MNDWNTEHKYIFAVKVKTLGDVFVFHLASNWVGEKVDGQSET